MKKIFYIILTPFFLLKISLAQDFHLSQFDANPLNINPALTGERLSGKNGIKLNINYRDQIAKYSNANGSFRTIAGAIDIPLNRRFSLGQYIGNNQSVNGIFTTNNLMLSTAYNIINPALDSSQRQNLSVGLQCGLVNINVNPQNNTYGSQYSPTAQNGFDSNIESGENLIRANVYKFNVNFGIYYRTKFRNDKHTAYSGFSLYNITKPNQSLINGVISTLPIRYNFHGGAIYKVDDRISLNPEFLYMNQAKANELNMRLLLLYKLNKQYEASFGIGHRKKNATILYLGLKVNGSVFRASYCIVTGYLYEYSNRGLEFSVIHLINKK